jgi:hypothetical protein
VRDADHVSIGLRDIVAEVLRKVERGYRPDVRKRLQVSRPLKMKEPRHFLKSHRIHARNDVDDSVDLSRMPKYLERPSTPSICGVIGCHSRVEEV